MSSLISVMECLAVFTITTENFSEQYYCFQCTSIALCMLGYSVCLGINCELILDKKFYVY